MFKKSSKKISSPWPFFRSVDEFDMIIAGVTLGVVDDCFLRTHSPKKLSVKIPLCLKMSLFGKSTWIRTLQRIAWMSLAFCIIDDNSPGSRITVEFLVTHQGLKFH